LKHGQGNAQDGSESERIYMLRNAIRLLQRSIRDEQGGEVIEYALILGLIIVICISAIATIGTKVLARWGSVNSSL
jgi:Flp pilus assembly pilin Flp